MIKVSPITRRKISWSLIMNKKGQIKLFGLIPFNQQQRNTCDHQIRDKFESKTLVLCVIGILTICSFLQFQKITFGLPGFYNFNNATVDYWYPDEDKEIAQIESFLKPQAKLLPFNYPPLQYLIVAAVNLPGRIISGKVPEIWVLALTSRMISALSVIASAFIVYLIARRIDNLAGIFSATLFSLAPINVMIGNDIKPIALGGLFLLCAIYFSLKLYENGFTLRHCLFVGFFLGAAAMCSHLTLTFLSLPLIIVYYSNTFPKTNGITKNAKINPKLDIVKIDKIIKIYGLIVGFIFISLSLTVLYFLSYQNELVLRIAENLYNSQYHEMNFEYHLSAIETYIVQIKNIMKLLFISGMIIAIYFIVRMKLLQAIVVLNYRSLELIYVVVFGVVTLVLLISTALNNLTPLSMLNFIISGRTYASINGGYFGMYPGTDSVPNFFLDIFPQCVGWPVLITGAISLLTIIKVRKFRRSIILLIVIFIPFAIQISLWNSTFRASRFAYNLFFIFYFCSGISLAFLINHDKKLLRNIGFILSIITVGYTALYTLAYQNSIGYNTDARVRTSIWINENIPQNATIAVDGTTDIPRSLGPIKSVVGVRYKKFEDEPDYCIIDGLEYYVIAKYFEKTEKGYKYLDLDWWPSKRPPEKYSIEKYNEIIKQKKYDLIKIIKSKNSSILGINFRTNFLIDPAFYYHRKFYIYKKN